jgi:hypothetical protein
MSKKDFDFDTLKGSTVKDSDGHTYTITSDDFDIGFDDRSDMRETMRFYWGISVDAVDEQGEKVQLLWERTEDIKDKSCISEDGQSYDDGRDAYDLFLEVCIDDEGNFEWPDEVVR